MSDSGDALRLVTPRVTHGGLDNFVAMFQIMWRPVGCFMCLASIAIANITDPSEPKMWVAAAAGGIGVAGRTAEKITGLVKTGSTDGHD